MTQEWADRKNKEQEARIAEVREKVVAFINALPQASDQIKTALIDGLKKEEQSNYPYFYAWKWRVLDYFDDMEDWDKQFAFMNIFEEYDKVLSWRGAYNRYVDSEPKHFSGDIIITDPGYIIPDEKFKRDDWHKCDCGREMEVLGIHNYMTRDTLYGDWSCTTYNMDTKEPIGSFCADAGLVSVFHLDEVLAYNPQYENELSKKWTVTLIRDFEGEVQFVVKMETGQYDYDTKWWKVGDVWEDYVVQVIGRGVNKKTGEPINFITSQTGL